MPQRVLELRQKLSPNLTQIQRLMMLPSMQQALLLLQMPAMELKPLVAAQLMQNPVIENIEDSEPDDDLTELEEEHEEIALEEEAPVEHSLTFTDHDFEILKHLDEELRDHFSQDVSFHEKRTHDDEKLQVYVENSIQAPASLFEHLMSQARDSFDQSDQLAIAEVLIASLDESGYLKTPLEEISNVYHFSIDQLKTVLHEIQQFEPPGVGAQSLQESLLIQLRHQGKENSIATIIVQNHYEDLLNNRIANIQKSLKCPLNDIASAIGRDIARLDLHPGTSFSPQTVQSIVPDITLKQEDEKLFPVLNDDFLPPIKINERYKKLLLGNELAPEARQFLEEHIASAKWLLRNLHQRNETLYRIVEILAKKQRVFFMQSDGPLVPLTMKAVSEELALNESTVARAVANKYLDCSRGLIPLRFFFSNAYTTEEGKEISSRTVRDLLLEMIKNEDKQRPLSDETLSKRLKERGVVCARRTIAKYRSELNLGNTLQRKKF